VLNTTWVWSAPPTAGATPNVSTAKTASKKKRTPFLTTGR
jgi:hypothetical protein